MMMTMTPPRPIDARVHTNTNTMMLCCSRLRLTTPCFTHHHTDPTKGREANGGQRAEQAAGSGSCDFVGRRGSSSSSSSSSNMFLLDWVYNVLASLGK